LQSADNYCQFLKDKEDSSTKAASLPLQSIANAWWGSHAKAILTRVLKK